MSIWNFFKNKKTDLIVLFVCSDKIEGYLTDENGIKFACIEKREVFGKDWNDIKANISKLLSNLNIKKSNTKARVILSKDLVSFSLKEFKKSFKEKKRIKINEIFNSLKKQNNLCVIDAKIEKLYADGFLIDKNISEIEAKEIKIVYSLFAIQKSFLNQLENFYSLKIEKKDILFFDYLILEFLKKKEKSFLFFDVGFKESSLFLVDNYSLINFSEKDIGFLNLQKDIKNDLKIGFFEIQYLKDLFLKGELNEEQASLFRKKIDNFINHLKVFLKDQLSIFGSEVLLPNKFYLYFSSDLFYVPYLKSSLKADVDWLESLNFLTTPPIQILNCKDVVLELAKEKSDDDITLNKLLVYDIIKKCY